MSIIHSYCKGRVLPQFQTEERHNSIALGYCTRGTSRSDTTTTMPQKSRNSRQRRPLPYRGDLCLSLLAFLGIIPNLQVCLSPAREECPEHNVYRVTHGRPCLRVAMGMRMVVMVMVVAVFRRWIVFGTTIRCIGISP